MSKYNFFLWPGQGYALDGPVAEEGECLEAAIDNLVSEIISNGWTDYFLTVEGYEHLCEEYGCELEGWSYWDATLSGAPYPVYLRTENLKWEEVTDGDVADAVEEIKDGEIAAWAGGTNK